MAILPQIILSTILILSALGVILVKKPVHASLSFLLTLLMLAGLYLQLSAEFIAVMQLLVYAGAILVIFMFVIVLFQDAHAQMEKYQGECSKLFLFLSGLAFLGTFFYLATKLSGIESSETALLEGFGSVETLGRALYLDFFFPFEAVILLFLVALIGALYVGKKER